MNWERERPLPRFVVIGAMKAGTTSLYYYLRRHPEIVLGDRKEIDFFLTPKSFAQGEEWYRRQFPRSFCRARGEFSVNYAKHPVFPGVPQRMARLLPQAKLIYVLRNPFERLVSQYRDHVLRGVEHATLRSRLEKADNEYVWNSDYAFQLERYLRCYDRRQVLLVSAEKLLTRRRAELRRVYRFLGVDPGFSHPDDRVIHNEFAAKWRPSELPGPRRKLLASALDPKLWERPSAARDRLDESVEKLARAWPDEKWLRASLSRPR